MEEAIERRLAHLRSGNPTCTKAPKKTARCWRSGGKPLPEGGFVVTSYADITSYKNARARTAVLADALEQRVADRTCDLDVVCQEAERAN